MEVEKIINLKFSIALIVNEHGGNFNLIFFFALLRKFDKFESLKPCTNPLCNVTSLQLQGEICET